MTKEEADDLEHTEKLLEAAIQIIMHEWGYTREQTVQWLNKRVEDND